MSKPIQRPEHLIIREYVRGLLVGKRVGMESLRDAFVPCYLEMIPPGDDTPTFEPVHRHDDAATMMKKDRPI